MLRLPLPTPLAARLEPSLSPFTLRFLYCLVLLWQSSGNICILMGLPCILYCLVLSLHPSGDARILTGSPHILALPCTLEAPLWQCLHSHGQASAPSHSHAVVVIAVGLPSLPYFLGMPPNALFIFVVRLPSLLYPLRLPTCLHIE
jgi:hypothetical protein